MSLLVIGDAKDTVDTFAARVTMREAVPLAAMTTLGVGGVARYYQRAETTADAYAATDWAQERGLPLLVLGRGSNMLISDNGFPGLVLRMAIRGISYHDVDGALEVTAGAGENWGRLVASSIARNLAGLECLAGIPGTVGAAPIQNIGAYGQEVQETITDVEALDLYTGKIVHFSNEACEFSYRMSRFKREAPDRYLVLGVTFRLIPGGQPTIRYGELERQLTARGITRPSLAEVRNTVIEIRRRKAMLLDARDPNTHSAGSFFMNPVISTQQYAMLEAAVGPHLQQGDRLPGYAVSDEQYKISAAWLIEHAGYARGYVHGNTGLSAHHTLAIINRGSATAREILDFAREIRDRVYDRFGIALVPEPTLVGIAWK